jgi:hypothetical protein
MAGGFWFVMGIFLLFIMVIDFLVESSTKKGRWLGKRLWLRRWPSSMRKEGG